MTVPVVGLPENLPEPSINSTNAAGNDFNTSASGVPGSTGPDPYDPDPYDPGPYFSDPDDPFRWFGLWGDELWDCEGLYDEVLDGTSEFNKGGSSSAATIMALLPTLMAFAPIITANIGFLCHLSTIQGLFAAGFTFGLPVRQLDTWKQVRTRVKDLLVNSQSCHGNSVTLLRPFSEMTNILLKPIKHTALLRKRPRHIWVQVLCLLFGSVQAGLIWCLLLVVPNIDSFYLIWLCPNWGSIVFIAWLGATFTLLGWLRARFERDSFGGDEVAFISDVTTLSTGNYWQRLLDRHPMIVIIRPSNDASEREPCWTNRLRTHYLIGIFQLFWICFLSFLFSSTIGGTLFWSLTMVVAFVTVVGLSRGISILVCWLVQRHLDLRVIEYDNLEEKRLMQRLLGGLPGVLVDIRQVRYNKARWQESVKMYLWGQQLSCGNVTEVPDVTDQCSLHTKSQRRDALVNWLIRAVCVISAACAATFSPKIIITLDDLGPEINYGTRTIRIIVLATSITYLHLGRTRRLLICNCGW